MTNRPLRLLQSSDLHVAASFSTPQGGGHHDHCRCPIHSVEAAALHHDVDAVLLVGDLFDHGRIPPATFEAVFEHLATFPVPVVLMPGNHDVHDDTSLYVRYADVLGASGVHFLDDPDGRSISLLDGSVRIWGRAMEVHEPAFRPLVGAPEGRPDDDAWYVVLGHGHHVGDEPAERSMRSSPITADDIRATRADYVGLGHWHVTTDVSTAEVPAWYCGSPVLTWSEGGALVPGAGAKVTKVSVAPPGIGCAPA
jgi:DNA repair protein SbcD/Mre11